MRSLYLLTCASLGLASFSCTTVHSRTAGGGAFDEAPMAQRLDSNHPDLEGTVNEEGKTAVPSYTEWRHGWGE